MRILVQKARGFRCNIRLFFTPKLALKNQRPIYPLLCLGSARKACMKPMHSFYLRVWLHISCIMHPYIVVITMTAIQRKKAKYATSNREGAENKK